MCLDSIIEGNEQIKHEETRRTQFNMKRGKNKRNNVHFQPGMCQAPLPIRAAHKCGVVYHL